MAAVETAEGPDPERCYRPAHSSPIHRVTTSIINEIFVCSQRRAIILSVFALL